MKFSCVKEHLAWALAAAERFTGKNLALPVLGNVLLGTQKNTLTVSATNLEYAIEVSVPGRGAGDGVVCVPSKVASALLQSIGEEKVDLEVKQGNLLVRTDTRDTRINGLPADDFPTIPKVKKTHGFWVEGTYLKKGLERVLPAVSPSEFKPELAGVQFSVVGTTLRLAATDTFRLAEANLPVQRKDEKENFSFILPLRTGQEIARLSGGEEVRVVIGENQAEFVSPPARVVSRLIEGRFPDYTAIIPKNFVTSSFLGHKALLDSIRASSIFASKLQEVHFSFAGGELEVSAANPDIGEYRTQLPAPATGKNTEASFNYRYLLDGLNSLDDEEIFVGVNGGDGPALIRNKTGDDFLYVLMPIRAA